MGELLKPHKNKYKYLCPLYKIGYLYSSVDIRLLINKKLTSRKCNFCYTSWLLLRFSDPGGNSMTSNKHDEKSLAQLPFEKKKETMKTDRTNNDNRLLILTGKGLKYLVWALAGFAIAFVVFHAFGAFSLAQSLLSVGIWIWFLRVAVSLFCLFAIAMIFESWR